MKRTKTNSFDWALIQWARACEESKLIDAEKIEPVLDAEKDDFGRLVDPLAFLASRAEKVLAALGTSSKKQRDRSMKVWAASAIFVIALGAIVFPFARVDRLLDGGVNLAGPFVFFILGQIFFLAVSIVLLCAAGLQTLKRRILKQDRPETFAEKLVEGLSGVVGAVVLICLHKLVPIFFTLFGHKGSERFAWKRRRTQNAGDKKERAGSSETALGSASGAVNDAAPRELGRKADSAQKGASLFWDTFFSRPRFLFFWGGSLSHLFWTSCSLCVLIVLGARMQGNRYDYCWRTSLEDEAAVKRCVDLLGAPIAWLGGTIPDENDVARLFDEHGVSSAAIVVKTPATISETASETANKRGGANEVAKQPSFFKDEALKEAARTRARWSYFLLGVVFVWCVAPRFLLFCVCHFMFRRALRDFLPDLRDPYFERLVVDAESYATSTASTFVDDPIEETLGTKGDADRKTNAKSANEQAAETDAGVASERDSAPEDGTNASNENMLDDVNAKRDDVSTSSVALDGADAPKDGAEDAGKELVKNDEEDASKDVANEDSTNEDAANEPSGAKDELQNAETQIASENVLTAAPDVLAAADRTTENASGANVENAPNVNEPNVNEPSAADSNDSPSAGNCVEERAFNEERPTVCAACGETSAAAADSTADAPAVIETETEKPTEVSTGPSVDVPIEKEAEERSDSKGFAAALKKVGAQITDAVPQVVETAKQAANVPMETLAFGYDAEYTPEQWSALLPIVPTPRVFGDVAGDFVLRKKLREYLDAEGERVGLCAFITDVGLSPAKHYTKFMRDVLIPGIPNARVYVVLSGSEKLRLKYGTQTNAVSERLEDWTNALRALSRSSGLTICPVFFYDADLDLPEPRARLRDLLRTCGDPNDLSVERKRDYVKWDASSRTVLAECRTIFTAVGFSSDEEEERRRIARVCADIFELYREETTTVADEGAFELRKMLGGSSILEKTWVTASNAKSALASAVAREGMAVKDTLLERCKEKGLSAEFLEQKLTNAWGLSEKMRSFCSRLSPKCAVATASIGLSIPALVAFAPLLGGAATATAVASTFGALGTLLPTSVASGVAAGALGAVAPMSLSACKKKLTSKLNGVFRTRTSSLEQDAASAESSFDASNAASNEASALGENALAQIESAAALVCVTSTWRVVLELQGRNEDEIAALIPEILAPIEESPLDSYEVVEKALEDVRALLPID